MTLEAGQRLLHYRLIEKIGEGGMGEVYLAEDTRLRRGVALKILPERLSADPDRLARFRREAETVAALSHPGIVTIYSIEEADGVHFMTMELVEGKGLDRLTPESGVALKLWLDVALQLASALAAAHARGVVHRDLKPANVMVTEEGRVKVLDFGLAKIAQRACAQSEETATEALTHAGMVMGTVPYMSPEQIEGKPTDVRTDIFSLGIVLYELACGARPFDGDSPAARMASTLKEPPAPLTARRSDLPPRLCEIVGRCLAKRGAERYATAAELHEEIELLKQEVVSGATPTVAPEPATAPKSIAVLPFANLSADPENEYFSDGMTEEIITALSQFEELRVAARTSSFSFKGKNPTVQEVADQLHVDTVLEGSVRRAGSRLRVTAQLIEAADGYQLWSERFDREMDDVFAVQDEIAGSISRKLQVTLAADQPAEACVRRGTDNPEAYDLYLRGRFHWDQRGDGLLKGLQFFERALELDPDYALAHTGIADVYAMWAFYGTKPGAEVLPKAMAAARRALEIDDSSTEAHTALGVTALQSWEFDLAEAEFKRAIELNPRYSLARYWYGFHFHQLIHGRHREGIEQCRIGLEADPLATFPQVMMALALIVGGRLEEAGPHLQRALARDPSNFFTHRTAGVHAMMEGRYEDAIRFYEKSYELSAHPWPALEGGSCLVLAGREDEAREMQRMLERRAEDEYISPFALAGIPAALGEADKAVAYLERAYEVRDPVLYVLGHWVYLRGLRGNPGFEAVRRKVGLNVEESS